MARSCYGVTIENAPKELKVIIFENLKLYMNQFSLNAFSIGYIEENTVLLFLKFRYLKSVDFIRNILAFQDNSNIRIDTFRNTKEQEHFSLRITAEDPEALFVGLQHSEISFLYELNQWVNVTEDFTPTDPFVLRNPEKFCFLKAYFRAKKCIL